MTYKLLIRRCGLFALVSMILLLNVSGCATFPGKDTPVYTFANLPPAPEKKTCIVISDKYANKYTEEDRAEIDEIVSMFEKSGYFLKAPERCTPNDNDKSSEMDVNFERNFKPGPYLVDLINAFISGYTLTIIPSRYREYYVMDVQLKRNDLVVKQYVYRDHTERWVQLFYLFKRPQPDYSKRTAIHDVYSRMIMNFLYDYTHDVQNGDIFATK